MGPWEFVALSAFCPAPKSVGSFWGKGRVLFSISGVPHKQGFQRRVQGPGTRITPPKVRIRAYGHVRPNLWPPGPAPKGACLKGVSGSRSQCLFVPNCPF